MRRVKHKEEIKTPIIIASRDAGGVGLGNQTSIRLGQVISYITGNNGDGTITVVIKGKEYKCYLQNRFRHPYKNELKLTPN